MVLSERLPPEQALTAVDGWGGDSYAAYERDGVSCVTVNYRGDTPEDLAQMQTALQAWAAKGPKGSASVTREDLTLVFTSCDPGKNAAKVASGKSMDALALALNRTYLSLAAGQGRSRRPGGPLRRGPAGARVHRRQLNNPQLDQRRVLAGDRACRAAGLSPDRSTHTSSTRLLVYSRPMRHNGRTTT